MRSRRLPAKYGATVAEFDVDAHPALEAAYGDLVPVLLRGGVDMVPCFATTILIARRSILRGCEGR